MCSTTECTIDSHYPRGGGWTEEGFKLPFSHTLVPAVPPFFLLAPSSLRILDCKILCNVVCFPISPLPPPWESRCPVFSRLLLTSHPLSPRTPAPPVPLHISNTPSVSGNQNLFEINGSLRCPLVNKPATSIQGNELHFEAAGV